MGNPLIRFTLLCNSDKQRAKAWWVGEAASSPLVNPALPAGNARLTSRTWATEQSRKSAPQSGCPCRRRILLAAVVTAVKFSGPGCPIGRSYVAMKSGAYMFQTRPFLTYSCRASAETPPQQDVPEMTSHQAPATFTSQVNRDFGSRRRSCDSKGHAIGYVAPRHFPTF